MKVEINYARLVVNAGNTLLVVGIIALLGVLGWGVITLCTEGFADASREKPSWTGVVQIIGVVVWGIGILVAIALGWAKLSTVAKSGGPAIKITRERGPRQF